MDLSNCKLISKSRIKLSDKSSDYKLWESAAPGSPSKDPSTKEGILHVSRSVPRLYNKIKERYSPTTGIEANRWESSNKKLIKLSPIEHSKERKFVNISIPILNSGVNLRNYVKPNGLVSIHKPHEEEVYKSSNWNTPVYRNGLTGSKLTRYKSKPAAFKVKSDKSVDKKESPKESFFESDSERINFDYKEPYIQLILGKKAKDFLKLFNDPINILYSCLLYNLLSENFKCLLSFLTKNYEKNHYNYNKFIKNLTITHLFIVKLSFF